MKQAKQMQEKMLQLQEELAAKTVEATAGGGMVSVAVNGKFEILSLKIEKEVVNPDDVEMLQDLIMAAVNEGIFRDGEDHGGDADPRTDVGGAMSGYALPIQRLIKELSRFPGIGEKTAARLANHILHVSTEEARRLAETILDVKYKIRFCSVCFNLAEGELCNVCSDPARNRGLICVVEEPDSLIALEMSGWYSGVYHVLHGALSPLDGIGPEHLRIGELLDRIAAHPVEEVIVATNPSVAGETTALLLSKLLKERGVNVTRIALGVPVGGDLKYTDRMTLAKCLEFRRGV
jgi:recombination protein RecR